MHCREILFTPRCSPRARKFPRSVNFSVRRTVVELRSVKVNQFSDFGLFSLYKSPKTYLSVSSLSAQGLHRRMIPIFRVVVQGPKGCLPAPDISCDFWQGSWRPQTCPNFHLWQMAIPIHNATIHRASDLDHRCLKTHNSDDECTFPPNIFAPTPKITQKPHFGGPFNAKPIIQRALRQSHVNWATTLKLYGYIVKYLSYVKIFALGNLGTPIISETTNASR